MSKLSGYLMNAVPNYELERIANPLIARAEWFVLWEYCFPQLSGSYWSTDDGPPRLPVKPKAERKLAATLRPDCPVSSDRTRREQTLASSPASDLQRVDRWPSLECFPYLRTGTLT